MIFWIVFINKSKMISSQYAPGRFILLFNFAAVSLAIADCTSLSVKYKWVAKSVGSFLPVTRPEKFLRCKSYSSYPMVINLGKHKITLAVKPQQPAFRHTQFLKMAHPFLRNGLEGYATFPADGDNQTSHRHPNDENLLKDNQSGQLQMHSRQLSRQNGFPYCKGFISIFLWSHS